MNELFGFRNVGCLVFKTFCEDHFFAMLKLDLWDNDGCWVREKFNSKVQPLQSFISSFKELASGAV